MNNLQIFSSPEFGQVRVVMKGKEPWFVGKDVADVLEYQNGSRDINRHVDEDDRMKEMVSDGKQLKETILINESGLYSLVLSSKLPTAKKFKHWVTSEVLPSIRKTGSPDGGKVNAKLAELGLQEKRGKEWHLTEKGKQYGEAKPFTQNGHSGYQIGWGKSVIELLRSKLN